MQKSRVYNNIFLGIIIDNLLNWKEQIKYIKTKISKTIAILYKVKDIVNHNSLRLLSCSLILPYLTYCVEIWGNTYKTVIDPIFILQKRAIRIINKTEYRAHTNPLFIENNLLKLEDLVDLNTYIFVYKAKNNLLPNCIQNLFVKRESTYDLRGFHICNIPFARTDTRAHCISVKGVTVVYGTNQMINL